MRILHVVHTPRYSGAEMLVASLTSAHASMGHVSAVAAINPPEEDFLPVTAAQAKNGIEWLCPGHALSKLERLSFLKNVATKFQADVIFAHSVIPAAYARAVNMGRVITVLHSADEDDYQSKYFIYAEKLLQFRSSGVIAVSEVARQNYKNKFTRPKTIHIPNGIKTSDILSAKNTRQECRAGLGFDSSDYVVVQIGRINGVKQQHLSLAAIAPLIKNNKNLHFLIAGLTEDNDYLQNLKQIAATEEIQHNIHFLGPRKDVANLLAAADLYLMPSLKEAHSVAMIEALASGLPIVASEIPSFQYIKSFEGTELVIPDEITSFTGAINKMTSEKNRFNRSLKGLDIEDTAIAYLKFAHEA